VRILALIPARGGSKRLPGKNVRLLGGKPLIAWTIEAARGLPEICDRLVSTDDGSIASEARNVGALVPWLRPKELATDSATLVDVSIHALDWYENERGTVDGLLLLQPTSPFRTAETIRKGIELFESNERWPVLGVSPAQAHPLWTFRLEGGKLVPFIDNQEFGGQSQDLPTAYVLNGTFYLIAPDELRRQRSFFTINAIPLLVESPKEILDIDTEWDWKMAEHYNNAPNNEKMQPQ
jgi:CMP-N,N'-diacetyllegionaminic acid synthase